jgi:RimJ/RimL family protein N-acetyltransferase
MIEYHRILRGEKQAFTDLMNTVVEGLSRKDFFIPFTSAEIDAMFDENIAVPYGAYEDGRLVGTAQLYLGDAFVNAIKKAVGIGDKREAEFGGVMVLKEYRNRGIMKHFAQILIDEARNRGFDYIVACAHKENTASNIAIQSTGARLKHTGDLNGHRDRNMYLLDL